MNMNERYKKFILVSVFSVLVTMYLSYHVFILLFGDNSLEVYHDLKDKKKWLDSEILKLQKENAYLQKEYFELKNLEPEE